MNRVLVKYALLLSLAVGGMYLGYGIIHKITHKKEVSYRVARLPRFQFRDAEGPVLTAQHLKNKPAWLLYFDSSCEFCRMEIRDIVKNKERLADIQVIMISAEEMPVLQKFRKEQGFESLKNIHIVRDSSHQCYERFGLVSTPSSLLYDTQGALVERFNGVVKVEKILHLFKHQ